MPTYKNIRIKKRGGGTRLQRVQVLASGKYKFVKNLTKSKSSSKTKTRSYGGSGNVSEKKRRKFTIPFALVLPVVASPFIPGNPTRRESPFALARDGHYDKAMQDYATGWTGVNFRAAAEGQGLKLCVPIYLVSTLIGGVVHKIAGFLGINRMLGQARVPIVRV